MKLAPYPKYKSSGVEWMGDVPAHWEITKLKKLVSFIEEKESEVDGENRLPYVGLEHIESWTGMLCVRDSAFVPTSVSNRFRSGDVLFGKLRPYLAKACKPSFEGICSSELLVLRPRSGIEGRFLLHLLLTKGFISSVDSSTYGAKMPRANWNDVISCVLPVPSLKEQRAIAGFLDREAAKIDTLIDKKQTLIERLKEKRTVLITRTVTQGLPPDAARAAGLEPEPKMRASGVEWLGDVPAHWEVKRGRFCVEVQPSSNRLRELSPDNEVSFVPMEAVGEYGGLDLEQTRAVAERGSGYTEFEDGDVIVAKITPCFENGKGALASGLLNGAAIGTTELHVLRPRSNLDRRLLFYFTISPLFRTLGEGEMYGAGGQKRVPTSFCEDVPIPLAPLDEQHAIADFLDRETAKIDGLVAKVETAIARLREYRAALITAAVTGQVDVRGGRSLSLSKGRGRVWR